MDTHDNSYWDEATGTRIYPWPARPAPLPPLASERGDYAAGAARCRVLLAERGHPVVNLIDGHNREGLEAIAAAQVAESRAARLIV